MIYFKELLLLKNIKGIGNVKINKEYVPLLKSGMAYNSLLEVLHKKYDIEIVNNAVKKTAEAVTRLSERKDIEIITVFDSGYPESLMDMDYNRPPILYIKGDSSILNQAGMAVIGTREPSEKGISMSKVIVNKIIKEHDFNVISGLAIGCDEIAHKETIANNGKTLAVLPSGFDNIVPVKNKELAEEIVINGGCLVSEYEPDVVVNNSNFIKRDALIATLANTILVIECGIKSGTMHTVKFADKIGRTIACCYPENLTSGNFEGNKYIVENYGGIKIRRATDLQKVVNLKTNTTKEEQLTFMEI